MLKSLTALSALVLATTLSLAPAAAQSGARQELPVNIGGQSMRLIAPAGHCILTRSNPKDAGLISATEASLAGNNQLHLTSAECADLEDWRAGRKPILDTMVQMQSLVALQGQNLAGQEPSVLRDTCAELGRSSATFKIDDTAGIKRRIDDNAAQAGFILLGAILLDQQGCYALGRLNVNTPQGRSSRLMIIATAVVKGKLMYFARVGTTDLSVDMARRLQRETAGDIRTNLDANK